MNAVLAAVAFVAMSFATAELSRTSRPIVVVGSGLTLSACLLAALAFGLGEVRSAGALSGTASSGPFLLVRYLGLLPTALANLCYCSGVARCRTAIVGLVASMIEPLLAALFAALLLGEQLSATMALGCALLMAAMVLLWRSERTENTKALRLPTAFQAGQEAEAGHQRDTSCASGQL